MRKKLIKTLTFIFGLYFVLEFFLPAEIGGDFDKMAVRTPSVIRKPDSQEYTLFYVGEYDKQNQSIGMVTGKTGSPNEIEKNPANPLIRQTLFNSEDRRGFSSLSAIQSGEEYQIYYLGSDLEKNKTICWASSPDGQSWKKHGKLVFSGNTPWRQRNEAEESYTMHKYGKLNAIAAFENNEKTALFITYLNSDGKLVGSVAEPEKEKTTWKLSDEIIPLYDLIELRTIAEITSISMVQSNEQLEAWLCFDNGQVFLMPFPPEVKAEEYKLPNDLDLGINDLAVIANGEDRLAFFTSVTKNGNETVKKIYTAEIREDVKLIEPISEGPVLVSSEHKPRFSNPLSKGTIFAGRFLQIIAAFAIGLGVVNLCLVHGKNVVITRKQTYNSIIFFAFAIVMFTATYFGRPLQEEIDSTKTARLESVPEYEKKDVQNQIESDAREKSPNYFILAVIYDFNYKFLIRSLATSVAGLISFYMVGAAFRSFRVRSVEAFLLVISAVIVLLGQIPIGAMMHQYLRMDIPWLSGKLLYVFNTGAYRGVLLGMFIGGISMSLKIWLGLEKGMYHGT